MTGAESTRRDGGTPGPRAVLEDRPLIVVSNREPYSHGYDDAGEISVSRPAGGLTSALDPVLQDVGGTWIAWGSGDADREVVDEHDRVGVPPEDPGYTLRRVWLSEATVERYYYGYANQVLWPLAHGMPSKMHYDADFWRQYRQANVHFAEVVAEEAERADGDPVVWFQDYHFALAPGVVRSLVPDATLMHFWHIPWPPWETFRRGPHPQQVLDGMLANDVVAFHTEHDMSFFVDCAEWAMDATYLDDDGAVDVGSTTTRVRTNPLGVEADAFADRARSAEADEFWDPFAAEHDLADQSLLVGVDRLDYTKGITHRLDAVERFFEAYPDRRGEVTLVQKGSESRSRIDEYQAVQRRVADRVKTLNDRLGTETWQPVVYTTEFLPQAGIAALYREADAALVSSLRDGMNLVAKEFVAAQVDDPGTLILSPFAGAAGELGDVALTVNPIDTEAFAAQIEQAIEMPPSERERLMDELQRRVRSADSADWIDAQFETLAEIG